MFFRNVWASHPQTHRGQLAHVALSFLNNGQLLASARPPIYGIVILLEALEAGPVPIELVAVTVNV
jgi:hypothetical protein